MAVQHTIPVHTDPAYQVSIGSGLLQDCGPFLRPLLGDCHLAVIADSNVAPLYLEPVTKSLRDAGFTVSTCLFPAGEEHKTIKTLTWILEFLADSQLTRSDCVVALGGGVCGDMAGFAAAVYLRGIRCVQLPTTLLSAVDSSVGGKTAIDLAVGKNLVGAFLQPSAVLCDTDCLSTLTPALFADGAAEAIKTGVLVGPSLFHALEGGLLRSSPADAIGRCVTYKAGVVEQDEKEQGERRLLNLGHTVAHGIEKCSGYRISHGHAVAAGLAVIARASEALGWTDGPIADDVCRCLQAHQLPITTDFPPAQLAEAALSDKKRSGSSITLVIPQALGRCVQRTVPVEQLEDIIFAGLEG